MTGFKKISKIWLIAFAVLFCDVGFGITKSKKRQSTVDVVERKREKQKTAKARVQISKAAIYAQTVEKKLLSGLGKTISYLDKQASRQRKRSRGKMQFVEKALQLRVEYAILQRNQEEQVYDNQYNRWEAKGAKGREPKLNTNKSNSLWKSVAKKSSTFLKEYPKAPNADKVLFQKGFAYEFLAQRKTAAKIYSQLVQKYPKSETAGEAYFSLGEYYFDRNEFRNSMNNYKKAIRYKRSKRYGWSLFKLAWCHFNLGQYNTAIKHWQKVVSHSRTQGNRGIRLKEEALRDMVYGYAELKVINSAIRYFKANGGRKYIGGLLQLLATTFSDQGQFTNAIKVAKRYQREEPYGDKGPEMQKFVIELYNDLGRKSNVWRELDAFGRKFGPKSAWYRNQKDKRLKLESQKLIKDQMLYYAKITHKSAQDDKDRGGFRQAIVGYDLFLRNYPKSREVAEIQFNKADIFYFLKKYKSSGDLYRIIGKMGKKNAVIFNSKNGKPKSIHKDSASFMLDAYGKNFEKEFKKMAKFKPDFTKRPRPLSKNAKLYIEGCLQYMKWYPTDKKATFTCEKDITKIYYQTNNKKLARQYLMLLAKKYPKRKEGKFSAEQLLATYAVKKGSKRKLTKQDKTELAGYIDQFLKVPQYSKGKFGKALRKQKRSFELEGIKNEKNTSKRAVAYEKAALKNPKADDAATLFYNASVDYIKAGQVNSAMRNYKRLHKQYPKFVKSQDVLKDLAQISEAQLNYREAISYYSQYAKKYPKDKLTPAAIGKKCELSAANGSTAAWSYCASLVKYDAPLARNVVDNMLFSYQIKGEIGNLTRYTKVYNSRFKPSANEKLAALARVYESGKSKRNEANLMKALRSAGKNASGYGLRTAAGVIYKKSASAIRTYKKYKLKGGTVGNLQGSIQRKNVELVKLETRLKPVIQTQDAYWGVNVLFEVGKAKLDFAKMLENPPGLKGVKIEDLKKQLAGDAKALRQQASVLFKQAETTARKQKILSPAVAQLMAIRSAGDGADITFDEYVSTPDFVGAEIPSSLKRSL